MHRIGRIVRTGGLACYDRLGPEFSGQIRSMPAFDALIYSENRRFGSFGVLRENHSGAIIASASIFDNGLSLFRCAGKEKMMRTWTSMPGPIPIPTTFLMRKFVPG